MMKGTIMMPGEGERLLQARRKKLWGSIGALVIAGAVGGFVVGLVSGHQQLEFDSLTSLPDWVKFVAVAVMIASFSYGCWSFARSVDELEIADNLWGSTASYYF